MEYKGDLVDKLMAVSDCGSGGQVIIDGATLEQLADKTFSIARLVPPIDPHLPDTHEPIRCSHHALPPSLPSFGKIIIEYNCQYILSY